MKRFIYLYTVVIVMAFLLFFGVFCTEFTPTITKDNDTKNASSTFIDINDVGGYTTTITKFVGPKALRYQMFLVEKATGNNTRGGISVGEYSGNEIGYFSLMHIGHSSSFPLWMSIRLNDKIISFAASGIRGILGLPPLTTEMMSEFYGKDVRISFDASKDQIRDTFYSPDGESMVVQDNSAYRYIPIMWGMSKAEMPAVDESVYVPQYIAWLPSNLTTQNDAELKLPYTVTWNADPRNENGVAIIIDYDPRNQQTINSLASKENEIVIPIEAQDNGSFVLTSEHFEQIPDNAVVKITLARGAYKFLQDTRTDAQYPAEFNSSATVLFMNLQK